MLRSNISFPSSASKSKPNKKQTEAEDKLNGKKVSPSLLSPSTGLLFALNFLRLCGLVVRVLGYRSGGPGSIPGTTRKKCSGSGTGSTQPREY
jgi:hypothetical protein